MYLEDSAARYFDTLHCTPKWEEFKRHWLHKYTLWGSDVKYRRRYYTIRQETEDPDPYIAEFQHRLSQVSDPGEKEVFHTFLEGSNKTLQQHLHRKGVWNLETAIPVARSNHLARSQTQQNATAPKPMGFERTKGVPQHLCSHGPQPGVQPLLPRILPTPTH